MAERRGNNKNNHTPGSPRDLVEWARSQYELLNARRTRAEIGSAVQDEASSKSPHGLVEWAKSQQELLDQRTTVDSQKLTPSNEENRKTERAGEQPPSKEDELPADFLIGKFVEGPRLTRIMTPNGVVTKSTNIGSTGSTSTGKELVPAYPHTPVLRRSVTLGHDTQTGEEVALGEVERYGGLYVLGQARSGKSNLLMNMALQDMEQGRGLLFIDPHVDAIRDILARLPPHREADVILLDPSEDKHAFGINVLDRQNENIDDTFNRTKALFSKLYGDPQSGRLDVMLNQYLDNTIYALLEWPGTTLLDIEPFVENKTYRETILRNVKNDRVRDFWHNQFDRLPLATKREQLGSTLRRVNAFLVHHRIRDVVGQQKTTIDFQKVIAKQKILLLRMQAWLEQDQKRFLGTLIVSELLRAVFSRSDLDREERAAFALYCDEFQEFSTPDFAKLFTQTGKFNIMPTVAHQVRGQFGLLDPNREATLGAPNKLVFSLNPTDARELAPLYADNPTPAEVRLERVYGLSQEPVRDLLQGGQHPNPEIREFVRRYLRPLEERVEDLRDDIEFERMVRMDFFDQAMLFRIEDAMETAANPRGLRGGALTSAYQMAEGAHRHTQVMMDMHDAYRQTKWTIRGFNKFFTAIMEGEIKPSPGEERFAQFLLERARSFNRLPELEAHALQLFIQLEYGSPDAKRILPMDIALASPLHKSEAERLIWEAKEQTRKDQEEYRHHSYDTSWRVRLESFGVKREEMPECPDCLSSTLGSISLWSRGSFEFFLTAYVPNYYNPLAWEMWDAADQSIKEMIAEDHLHIKRVLREREIFEEWYQKNQNWWEKFWPRVAEYKYNLIREERRKHYDPSHLGSYEVKQPKDWPWAWLWDITTLYIDFFWLRTFPDFRSLIMPFTADKFAPSLRQWLLPYDVDWHIEEIEMLFGNDLGSEGPPFTFFKQPVPPSISDYRKLFRRSVVSEILQFLKTHKEGAFVVFRLLGEARAFGAWGLPDIENRDPVDICLLARRLNNLMLRYRENADAFVNHFSYEATQYVQESTTEDYNERTGKYDCDYRFKRITYGMKGNSTSANSRYELYVTPLKFEFNWSQEAKTLLELFLSKAPIAQREWWRLTDEDARNYVFTYALRRISQVHTVIYLPPASTQAQEVVRTFERLQNEYDWQQAWDWARKKIDSSQKNDDWHRERNIANAWKQIAYDPHAIFVIPRIPPNRLTARVLTAKELETLHALCYKIIVQSAIAKNALGVIGKFVEFCRLLSLPENHVMRQSGVYTERQVIPRPVRDMEAEKAQELMRLDVGVAYLYGRQAGVQVIRKLHTEKLDDRFRARNRPAEIEQKVLQNGVEFNYLKSRHEVEAELDQRQKQWQISPTDPPKPRSRSRKRPSGTPPPGWG